ncbi:MAG: PEP/pyruvate-binding domain-containing protein, partial [Synechococcaceae cyanobacterium]
MTEPSTTTATSTNADTNGAEALVLPFEQLGIDALPLVGGKNASLGEMIRELSSVGVRVPSGFATTATAYRLLLEQNDLRHQLASLLRDLDTEDLPRLQQAGSACRALVLETPLPASLEGAILAAYRQLDGGGDCGGSGGSGGSGDCSGSGGGVGLAVAVRSSATAEDLPDASFAGQQETFLHVQGEESLLMACRRCFASLFTDRAISYRQLHGFAHLEVALSIGVQRMVRSDLACSGVMFSLDTESGFRDAVLLNAAYGLGESIVQGAVNPDELL